MKLKTCTYIFLMGALIANAYAVNTSVITVKDGTKLEGEIISKNGNKVKLQTKMMGVVELDQNNIANITEKTSVITLKDGTKVEGDILSKDNGKIKIQTKMLGTVELDNKNIDNISDKDSNNLHSESNNNVANDENTKSNELQNKILKDPEVVKELYGLIQQDDIKNTLTEDNKNKFLSNPKVQELINKIQQKLSK